MKQHVFIVSDGTGRTAEQLLKAALVQFESTKVKTHICPNVRREEQILKIIANAYKINGLIIHTLVSRELRHLILYQGRLHDLYTIDVMGPLLGQLSNQFDNTPAEKPGIYGKLNKAYFQRIEAVEYTLRHDDGQRVEELEGADLVLLGVSRTFKTPLSVYMAHKGWRVANIPIVLGIPLPESVYALPPEKVFCLTTYSRRLSELRKNRDKHLGGFTGQYADRIHVKEELNYARRIFRIHPKWKVIIVTNKPIEEISSEILIHLRKNKN